MSSDWERVGAVFHELIELTPPERERRLDEISQDHEEIARQVRALLKGHETGDGVLGPLDALLGPDDKASDDPLQLLGARIGQYEVGEFLSAGGMGLVYRATDVRLERPVALKFAPPLSTADPSFRERFLREARSAAALDHANICTIYEVGETANGQMYIAMPLYQGQTLRKMLADGPLDAATALDTAAQVAAGLNAAHEMGLVHRDIKPANLMVTPKRVKILDFGIARTDESALTGTGDQLGTPAYMSPEQTHGAKVDKNTDLWSLGAVLYEMLTGKRPFRGGSRDALVHSIRNDAPADPRTLHEGISDEAAAIALELLDRDPARRGAAFDRLLAQAGGEQTAATRAPAPRSEPASPSPTGAGVAPGTVEENATRTTGGTSAEPAAGSSADGGAPAPESERGGFSLASLKERKIVQWTVAYLAGGWLTLEVFDFFDGRYGWPDWSFTILLVLLGLGFTVTLVLAWYHGEEGRQRVTGAELLILAGLMLVAAQLTAIFLGGGSGESGAQPLTSDATRPEVAESPALPRIAVLPMANRGSEDDQAFVDGIHDELISQLSKIRSLEIAPLTSVLQYRDTPKNSRTIGEELGAQFIVEGTVQRVEDRIRLRASLIDASNDRVVWNEDYDRDLSVSGILDLQREVALVLATTLGAEVLPAEADRLAVGAPENLEAYESYLTGLRHLRAITLRGDDYADAIGAFSAAIEAEPDWAPPYAGLGAVRHWMASRGVDSETNYPLSQIALERAVELDSLLAPAWASLGIVRHWWLRDFEGAERAYENAERLGSTSGWGSGLLHWSWGRFDAAVSDLEGFLRRDPLSTIAHYHLGAVHTCAGRHEEALVSLAASDRLAGTDTPSPYRAEAYFKTGRPREAWADVAGLIDDGWQPEILAYAYALGDSVARAEEFLAEAETELEGSPQSVSGRTRSFGAAAAVLLGQQERGLEFLERHAERSLLGMLYLRCPEELGALRGNERYEALLDLVGYPPLDP